MEASLPRLLDEGLSIEEDLPKCSQVHDAVGRVIGKRHNNIALSQRQARLTQTRFS
jgi:hypothetical protein